MRGPIQTVVLSPTLRRLLRDHQIFCSVDCCKERAFQLTEGSITRWLGSEREDRTREVVTEVEDVEAQTRSVAGRINLAARGLESEWDADKFRAFWARFRGAYTLAVDASRRGTA